MQTKFEVKIKWNQMTSNEVKKKINQDKLKKINRNEMKRKEKGPNFI